MALMCSDCPNPSREMNDKTLHEGSTVREPGEGLCPSCSSRRMLMVRAVNALPSTLADIKAKRMSVGVG